MFVDQELADSWCYMEDEYAVICKTVLWYLCEGGFSVVAVLKSKYRATLESENDAHKLIKDQQVHPTH